MQAMPVEERNWDAAAKTMTVFRDPGSIGADLVAVCPEGGGVLRHVDSARADVLIPREMPGYRVPQRQAAGAVISASLHQHLPDLRTSW